MPLQRHLTALLCLLALGAGGSAAYTVRPGDTLSGIASKLGVRAADLAAANGMTNPNRLLAGRSLSVPGGVSAPAAPAARTHLVRAGENLTTIARRHGVSASTLASANRLDPTRVLPLGARLVVPSGPGGAAQGGYPSRLRSSPERLTLIPHFRRWAQGNAIPADLLMAMTWLESGWQNSVVSPVGARGIGQLMPDTVDFVRDELIGVRSLDPRVPTDNIRMSARYLRYLLSQSGGDVRTALAGYYQGPRSVRERGLYDDTVVYIDTVLALRSSFRS